MDLLSTNQITVFTVVNSKYHIEGNRVLYNGGAIHFLKLCELIEIWYSKYTTSHTFSLYQLRFDIV